MNDDTADQPYILSLTLQSDMEPVRSLAYLEKEHTLLAGSQGALVARYFLPKKGTAASDNGNDNVHGIAMDAFRSTHSHGVSVILPSNSVSEDGIFVTGCRDGKIRLFREKDLVMELQGHDKNVNSLSWVSNRHSPNLILVSGSWDGTARIWDMKTGACLQVLEGHENTTVVLGLSDGRIVTGSAGVAQNNAIVDTKLRVWDHRDGSYKLSKTVPYPGGPIRGLCCIPLFSHAPPAYTHRNDDVDAMSTDNDRMFATCSNDGSVKVWDVDSMEIICTFTHPGSPMVLSVLAGPDGTILSCTEEGDLNVWSFDDIIHPQQTLRHSSTVWACAVLPNGDIASACQDGSVRCFSRDPQKACNESELQEFSESGKRTGKGPSSEEIEKLPRWELRQVVVGKSEGQVQMFQKDGGAKAIAAQWSQASSTWIEVGEVLSTRDSNTGGIIDGISYDFIFPIEFESNGGVHNLKIGYNDGDNPFVVAQTFIDRHELPQYHLQQIADYVISRAGKSPVELGGDASSNLHASTVKPQPAITAYDNLPNKLCMTFDVDSVNIQKIIGKIKELNDQIKSPEWNLSDDDIALIENTLSTLNKLNRYHSSKISSSELHILYKTMQKYPCSMIFPVVDILKMCALHPDATSLTREGFWKSVICELTKRCRESVVDSGKGSAAVTLLAFRLLSNCFKQSGSARAAIDCASTIISISIESINSSSKNVRLAIATVLLNMSTVISQKDEMFSESIANELINSLSLIFDDPAYTENKTTAARALLALGTILFAMRQKGLRSSHESKLGTAINNVEESPLQKEVLDLLNV
mmetsp:Transcript_4966/g.6739  ORF Transcript_4966/g.6739 Transcript_4966/m.6739 type:complete len:810 (-) Transcript_4966:216-2645(-)|eukprot:CAMPEP_0116058104 /NCGR_PEP_ID=MMETSP0322-20121206/5005_1 /TAXON_ID=163516 /ORGANISM="Leptocylindrus danicus var. apora, Strain B651" /LENGTH=809 /DNA_ID=CAMNT_0003542237 /DNA_START=32 /DNA_END=2461 /DNA_ORIENTATION=-